MKLPGKLNWEKIDSLASNLSFLLSSSEEENQWHQSLNNKPSTIDKSELITELWQNLSRIDKDDYLATMLGPKQLDLTRSTLMTTLYSLLFLIGFTGNFLTCIIILCNSYMRVPANFFLFSLAIADIITLIGGKEGRRPSFKIGGSVAKTRPKIKTLYFREKLETLEK